MMKFEKFVSPVVFCAQGTDCRVVETDGRLEIEVQGRDGKGWIPYRASYIDYLERQVKERVKYE